MNNEPSAKEPWMLTVTCRGCGAKIRFPINRGKLRVRCPWCQAWFIFSWHPANLWDLMKRQLRGAAPGLPLRRPLDIRTKIILLGVAAALVVIVLQVCPPGSH